MDKLSKQTNKKIQQTLNMPVFLYTKNPPPEMLLTFLPLISEVLPLTARGISDSQVTDGAATETDDSGRWRQDELEKHGCKMLYHQDYLRKGKPDYSTF